MRPGYRKVFFFSEKVNAKVGWKKFYFSSPRIFFRYRSLNLATVRLRHTDFPPYHLMILLIKQRNLFCVDCDFLVAIDSFLDALFVDKKCCCCLFSLIQLRLNCKITCQIFCYLNLMTEPKATNEHYSFRWKMFAMLGIYAQKKFRLVLN